jgi:hypothetical protein
LKNWVDYYNVKIIETPTSIEIWEYIDKPVIYTVKTQNEEKKDTIIEENKDLETKVSASEHYDALKRKQKHYKKMRWEIARIVDCNFDNKTKFITLTFKNNIDDITFTNYEFNKFIKRLNFYLYNTKKQELKYLAVWEKQKRGAIHYHIIFFKLPYIKSKVLQEIWGHGFIKINKIDVDSKDNRGRYVSKYFSKDIDDKNYKQKAFFKSQNLIMPKVDLLKVDGCLDFSNDDVVYTKTYSRKSPEFNSLRIEDCLSFTESSVRYTKIRRGSIFNDNYQE